jgi:predicted phosphodiesterase
MTRKHFFLGLFHVIAALGEAGAGGAVETPDVVGGTVYLDANTNGKRDAGEPGLPGVAVTDGVTFATSNAEGRYRIRIGDDEMFPFRQTQCVYPSWPDGLWPSRARWWVRLSEVEDADNVDFGMRKVPESEPFGFATFGDEHSGSAASYPHIAAELNALENVRFVVCLGDYGYAGRENASKSFGDIARAAAADFKVPVFHVPGNHDIVSVPEGGEVTPSDLWGHHTEHLGPPRFSFDYGGVHFVAIDSDRHDPKSGKATHGHPPTAAAWLRRDLERIDPVQTTFLLTHMLYGDNGVSEILRRQKTRFAYMGHTHIASCVDFDGTMGAVSFPLSVTSVNDGRFAVGERVIPGLKTHAGYSMSGIHYWESCVAPGLEACRRDSVTRANGGAALETKPADWAHIVAKFKVPDVGESGLRIGGNQTIDVIRRPGQLVVDGMVFDAPVSREGRDCTWQILIDRPYMGYMTLVTGEGGGEADRSRARVMLPVKVDAPHRVTPIGAAGAFSQIDLHALKPSPWPDAIRLYHWSPHAWKWGTEHYRDLFSGIDNERSQEMLRRHGIGRKTP